MGPVQFSLRQLIHCMESTAASAREQTPNKDWRATCSSVPCRSHWQVCTGSHFTLLPKHIYDSTSLAYIWLKKKIEQSMCEIHIVLIGRLHKGVNGVLHEYMQNSMCCSMDVLYLCVCLRDVGSWLSVYLPESPPTSIFFRFLASRIQMVSLPAVGT